MHADNREKYILVLGEGPIDGLDDTIITAEAKYCTILPNQKKKFYVKSVL